ncbi:GSCFA domain-containing protein [Polaribacter gangjinensis]|uniref:GSCFA domain-containing protein n=1 Tax=Polaribacter gangjinensis TaxID=574710 RepID=A0A2S7WCE6_9FLAO|nr:GSCFA domain-containing protein [Polaribacter gangjinensis]PQJ75298.1 GSCFA domain-containing protein [Polaribacter gangjinensis]
MKLQTQIPLQKETKNPINYHSKMVLLGSCFSENIGAKFDYFKFQNLQNPFGIFFHPKAIEKFIQQVISKKVFSENDIFFENERWHCFDAHSSLSSSNKEILLSNLNLEIESTNLALKNATHCFITLGTSWIYRNIETNEIVANCHKIPQKNFTKELLSVAEISASLQNIIAQIQSINPTITIIFTVSPVRHLKDGFVENTQSKAHLIAGIHSVLKGKNGCYFPSYEIMMDELRDYRFYAEDMIHPSKIAIDYIWKKLVTTWFSEDSIPIMNEVDSIQKAMLHRPFHENSEQHRAFLKQVNSKIAEIQKQFTSIQF